MENTPAFVDVDTDNVHDNTHTFKYNLNTAKAKKTLYEGALRGHLTRENKRTCINLSFSDGAFSQAVLSAVNDMKNGPKHFVIGKEDVERVSVESRKELSGKYVDTKLEFKVNKEKIVIHVYNTKQKMTIQGKKFKWFVDLYLEPFLKLKIKNNIDEIREINKKIINSFDAKNDRISQEDVVNS